MSDWAIQTLRQVAADLKTFEDGRIPQDALDGFVLSLQITYRELLVQEQLDGLFLQLVGRLLRESMENLIAFQHKEPKCPQLTPSVVCSGNVGRPKFDEYTRVPTHSTCRKWVYWSANSELWRISKYS
jgi:hypothetical protein